MAVVRVAVQVELGGQVAICKVCGSDLALDERYVCDDCDADESDEYDEDWL